MCEVTDNYYYLQPPNPWFSKDGSYYVTLIPSPQGNDGSFIHLAKVMVTVSTDELNPLTPKERVTTPHGSVSPNLQYFIELH